MPTKPALMDVAESERSFEEVEHERGMEGIDEEFTLVDELQNHGVGAADIQKLKIAGICTIKGVNMTSKRNLAKVKGLSEAKVDKIKEAAAKIQVQTIVPSFLML